MSNISRVKISALGKTITGKTPSSNNPEDFGSDYMFVTPSDSFDKKMMNLTERYLSEEGVQKLSSKLLPPNSIMVTCIGSAMGKVSMNETSCVTNQQINSIVPNNNFNPHYIYYTIKNNYKVLRNAATGSTAVPLLNKTDFDNLELLIHKDLPTQKSIAKVLSDLDAKIELNNRINRELEAMAKTLYDYWFVQFDFPFDFAQDKPNEQGKPYKSSGGKMVYNQELKREIPEGWAVKKLSQIAKTGSGGTPLSTKREYYENGEIPWINSGEVNEPFIVSTNNFITQAGLNNSSAKLFKKGTILMAMYGATAGKVSLIDLEACTNQAICGINPNKEFYKYYIKFGLEDLYKYLINLSSGSARDNLSQDKIKELRFIIPNDSLLMQFDKLVQPTMNKILTNLKQNQHLTALRDWLLPMLMNGQVTVRQAHGKLETEERLNMAAEPSVEYKKG